MLSTQWHKKINPPLQMYYAGEKKVFDQRPIAIFKIIPIAIYFKLVV